MFLHYLLPALAAAAPPIPREVFMMRAHPLASDTDFPDSTVLAYGDGTLGVKDPYQRGQPFNGVLMPDTGTIIQPDPCQCVKLDNLGRYIVNDSLYNAEVGVTVSNNVLKFKDGVVCCPTKNHIFMRQVNGKNAPCPRAVPVQLEYIPLPNKHQALGHEDEDGNEVDPGDDDDSSDDDDDDDDDDEELVAMGPGHSHGSASTSPDLGGFRSTHVHPSSPVVITHPASQTVPAKH